MGNRLQRRNVGRDGHWYLLDGEYAPGVTTVLGAGLAVPFNIPAQWASRLVAEFVADNRGWLLAAPNRQFVVDGLRALPMNQRDEAAVRGTTVHAYADQLRSGPVELDDRHTHLLSHVEAVARWLDEWDIEIVASEIPCAITAVRTCGTTDLIARAPKIVAKINARRALAGLDELDPGTLGVIDYKTGKALRDKDGVQVEAYRRSDLCHVDGVEGPMPACGWAGLCHVRSDGCDLRVNDTGFHDALFRLFRAALAEWEALDGKRGWIGRSSHTITVD